MDRDRDESGRPQSARPRDGLGRPLGHGAPGVPRQPDGVPRTPEHTLREAQRLLDAGRPFHAHEVFEDAWKATRDDPMAGLWKALAQLAVGRTHQLRGNAVGAQRLFLRAAEGLAPYAEIAPYGVDIAGLVTWAAVQSDDRAMPPLRSGSPGRRPEDRA